MFDMIRGLFRRRPPPEPFQDGVLGVIRFSADEELWQAKVEPGSNAWHIFIAGRQYPDADLLRHARDVASNAVAFREAVSSFLQQEAPKFPPGADNEVLSLRLESLNLLWPERPNDGMIYFDGGREGRLWRCDYVDRQPESLGFDS